MITRYFSKFLVSYSPERFMYERKTKQIIDGTSYNLVCLMIRVVPYIGICNFFLQKITNGFNLNDSVPV